MQGTLFRNFLIYASVLVATACNNDKGNSHSGALRFNLPEGRSFRYSMDFRTEQKGNGSTMVSFLKNSYIIEVVKDTAGLRKVKNTYEHFGVRIMGPDNQWTEVDSDHPTENKDSAAVNSMALMSDMYQALKGKSFYMLVNQEGKVVSVEGLQELMQSVVESLRVPEATKEMLRPNLQTMFSEETIRKSFEQSFNIYPNKVVSVGDTWEKQSEGNALMQASGKASYKVKNISGDSITVEAVSHLDNRDGNSDMNATYILDAPTGLIRRATIHSTISSVAPVTINGVIIGEEAGKQKAESRKQKAERRKEKWVFSQGIRPG